MDPVEKFVQSENINRFSEAFEKEADRGRQNTLRHLLLDEESRYGFRLEQLTLADQRIASSALRIEKQKQIIERLKHNGADVKEANRTLQNLTELQKLYVDYRFALLDALQRSML